MPIMHYGTTKPSTIPDGYFLCKCSKYVPQTTEERYIEGNYIVEGYFYTVVIPETRIDTWQAYSPDAFHAKFGSWGV